MAGHELSDAQCMHRWQKVLRPGLVKGAFCEKEDKVIVDCLREGGLKRRWTKQEDEKLCMAVKAVGTNDWKQIAEVHLAGHGRSDVQCLHRWQKVLRAGLVKGAFTEEEDKIIIECMREGGLTWMQIAERIPGRIGKQCRERWTNHLDPNLKKGGWTHEEDTILAEAQQRWGNAWTKIAKLLPGRAENAVKNRWNSAFRRKKSAQFGKTGGGGSPEGGEDTAAIAKARAAMELLDRDEKESSNGSSSSTADRLSETARGLGSSSCSSKHSGFHPTNGYPQTTGKNSRGTKRTSAGAGNKNLFGLGSPTTSTESNGHIPALRLPASALMGLLPGPGDLPTLVGDMSPSNVQQMSTFTGLENVRDSSSPSEVLDLFGDFEHHSAMDDGLLSLDGAPDDGLDVSLDNLDVVESRFDPSRLVQPPGVVKSFPQMVPGGDDHRVNLGDDDDDDDGDGLRHHQNPNHRHAHPSPLALSRSPLPNCPDDDLSCFYTTGRTGLTPNGPMQKTPPSGMMSGLSPHDDCSPTAFSPFVINDGVGHHVLDPDDLAIDLPVCEPVEVNVAPFPNEHTGHSEFMSPNGNEYHAAWGLPAPEVKIPTKVSELLGSSISKAPHGGLMRNLSTATDVTVISHNLSPTHHLMGSPRSALHL